MKIFNNNISIAAIIGGCFIVVVSIVSYSTIIIKGI